MSNLLSQYIEIFPTAKPRNTQRSSRLLYEDNIANIIRQIVDKPSFIISSKATNPPRLYSSSGSDSFQLGSGDAEFCLYGYYVKIKEDAIFTLSNTTDAKGFINVTATLKGVYDASNGLYSPLEICGEDDSELGAEPVYNGLQFYYCGEYENSVDVTTENNSVTVTVKFSLFSKHNETIYELCPQSYAKMSVGSLFLDGIDGKHN